MNEEYVDLRKSNEYKTLLKVFRQLRKEKIACLFHSYDSERNTEAFIAKIKKKGCTGRLWVYPKYVKAMSEFDASNNKEKFYTLYVNHSDFPERDPDKQKRTITRFIKLMNEYGVKTARHYEPFQSGIVKINIEDARRLQ